MKKFKKALCFGSLAFLACSATIVTLASTGVFKPASGGNDPSTWTYNHYTTLLPTATTDGVAEYWVSCSDPNLRKLPVEPKIEGKNITIVEKGQAKLDALKGQGEHLRLASPGKAIDAYFYNESEKVFKKTTGAVPHVLPHYVTHSVKNQGSSGSNIDSSYVTATVPGNGGYSTYHKPIVSEEGEIIGYVDTPSLSLGSPNVANSVTTFNEYVNAEADLTDTFYIGLASTLHYTDPSKWGDPIKLADVLEIRVNEKIESECTLPDTAILAYGEDAFCSYSIGSHSIPKSDYKLSQFSHFTIRRKYNPDIGGNLRIGWFYGNSWTSKTDSHSGALIRLANNATSDVKGFSNEGGSDFTKSYVNVPLDNQHVKLLIGKDEPTDNPPSFISGGGVRHIQQTGTGIEFAINVSNTRSDTSTPLCFFEFDAVREPLKNGANTPWFDDYSTDTSQVKILFACTNTNPNAQTTVNTPSGELHKGTAYYWTNHASTAGEGNGHPTTVSFALPLSKGTNTIKIVRDFKWGSEYFNFHGLNVYCNDATITLGTKP